MACCRKKPIPPENPEFRPNYRREIVAEKFWARHDVLKIDKENARVKYFKTELDKVFNYNAREHYPQPRYVNQDYGWIQGSKIEFYQHCDVNINNHPIIAQTVRNLCQKRTLESLQHCECKNVDPQDHWKIV